MSSILRGTRLIELCTPSISYDRQVQAASTAFDEEMWEIIDDTGQVVMIPNIMGLTDSKLVDVLAWQFHVDFYDVTRDLEFRKNLVQMSIIWHKTKGTVALVEEVLHTYWPGGAWITEWFDYKSPLPPNYADPTLAGTFVPTAVNISTNTITFSGIVNAEEVEFTSTGALPTPLVAGRIYFVVNATGTTFQVSLNPAGMVLNILDQGTGTHSLYQRSPAWHDRYRFRIMVDQAIISSAQEAEAVELISRYKPVSRWLEDIVYIQPPSELSIFWAGVSLPWHRITSLQPTNYP
jgi:P2-related tail formation protein